MTWKKLSNAEACLSNHDLKLTDHLKVAKWNVGQVKKAIAAVGQAKTKRPAGEPAFWIGGLLNSVG